MKIVLFGAPGAGKGTLAGHIKKVLPKIAHISTGDLFRYNIKEKTEIGRKAQEYIDAGKLVPDEVVIGMVKDRFSKEDVKKHGFMLDGFPRTLLQAQELDRITDVDLVLVINVARKIIHQRILGRISCPKCNKIYNIYNMPPKKDNICDVCGTELVHRSDDTEETLNARLDTYENNASPIIEYYKEKQIVKEIDGSDMVEMSEDEIKEILNLN